MQQAKALNPIPYTVQQAKGLGDTYRRELLDPKPYTLNPQGRSHDVNYYFFQLPSDFDMSLLKHLPSINATSHHLRTDRYMSVTLYSDDTG